MILTSYLFDGYPTALEGFRILHELNPAVTADQTSDHIYAHENVSLWRTRGEELCRVIYGPQFAPLMTNVSQFAPELRDAMIVEGYGKVLSRDQLPVKERELCVVAMLAAKDRLRQLLSHMLGSLRLGATDADLETALTAALELHPERSRKNLTDVLTRATTTFKRQNVTLNDILS